MGRFRAESRSQSEAKLGITRPGGCIVFGPEVPYWESSGLSAVLLDAAVRDVTSQLARPGASPLTLNVPAAALSDRSYRMALPHGDAAGADRGGDRRVPDMSGPNVGDDDRV